jgi:PAS domain S-box-containing protein
MKEIGILTRRLFLVPTLCLLLQVLAASDSASAQSVGPAGAADYPHGAIGVGSWNTRAEFKDIVVTSNGVVLYRSDFEKQGTNGLHFFGSGAWTAEDGVLRQTAIGYSYRATTGDTGWANYTLTLRARKLSGEDGFLVFFNWLDDNNWTRASIGKAKNTYASFQHCVNAKAVESDVVPCTIEADIWYDIKVVLNGPQMACYVNSILVCNAELSDGRLVAPSQSGTQPNPNAPTSPVLAEQAQPPGRAVETPGVPNPNPPTKPVAEAAKFIATPDISAAEAAALADALYRGAIGVGSWNTCAEFKDIVVTSNGVVLYRSDFEKQGTEGFRFFGSGAWTAEDGVLRQTAIAYSCRATTGDTGWADYTLTLRARKLSGQEGFLVFFNWVDDNTWSRARIGSKGNTRACFQHCIDAKAVDSEEVPCAIATGVWYDIKVVLNGPQMECYLNSDLLMKTRACELISTNVVYLGHATLVDYYVFQFRANGHIFQGTLRRDRGAPPALESGSLVRVRGIVPIGTSGTASETPSDPSAPEFDMLILTPDDVVLIQPPTWWNWQRLLWVSITFLTILVTAAAWIAMISRKNRLLKAAQIELQKANEELEMRVERRTADLARTNAELSHEQALLRTLLDNASDYIYFKDASSRFVRCSLSLCARSGLTHAQMVGKTDFDIYRDEHARSAFEDEQQIICTGQPLVGKLEEETHPDGRITWVMTTKMPWRDPEGKVIGTFGISRDVTEIKTAESRLAYERELFRMLMDTIPDSIYFKDLNSRFVRLSKAKVRRAILTLQSQFRTAHGPQEPMPSYLTDEEECSQYLEGKSDFDLCTEAEAREFLAEEERIIRTGDPIPSKITSLALPGGKLGWFYVTKMPWKDKTGGIIGTFGISRDITGIKEAEARLEQLHQQLVDASRKAGQAEVASSVLHNVGNVLNSVNVSVSLISDRLRHKKSENLAKAVGLFREHQADLSNFISHDPHGAMLIPYLEGFAQHYAQEEERMIEEIRSLGEHVNHIIEIVAMQHNYSKAGAVVEKVDLVGLAESALQMQSAAFLRHSVRVVREFDPVPTIVADKHRILQILVNLLQNAKRACSEQQPADKVVTVRLQKSGDDRVRVEVCDNGIGIAPENLPRLFTHGFTTRKDGHGLGLHSAALAARQMGGNLNGFSEGVGKGARFVLELPVEAPAN